MELISKTLSDSYGNTLFKVTFRTDKGKETVRTLSVDDYISLIKNSREEVKTGFLFLDEVPQGLIKCAVSEKPENFMAAFYLPSERTGSLVLGRPLNIIQPKRVAFYGQLNGQVFFNLFAVKDEVITDNTVLYTYPLGHASEFGNTCIGSAFATRAKNVKEAATLLSSFFIADNSGHMYTSTQTTLGIPFGELMQMLSEAQVFPEEILKPGAYNLKRAWDYFTKTNNI